MLYLFDGTEEADVRFKAYNGSGALTFQIQTNARQQPIRMADLYGNELSNRRPISIAPVDPRAFDKSVPRGERKRLQRTTLTLKIRWDGEDYTVVCPLIMSYDISPNAVVTSIRVQKVKHANKEERHVILTVKDNPVDKAALDATGVLSLNFGWRKLDDGSLRVATGIDPADDLVLSPHLMSGLSLADGLQKIRDNNSNPIHDRLVEWKKLNASILSPWFREQTETLSLWEKQKRLAKLTLAWRQNRFDGDETMFEVMEAWRYDDHHLWNQQENHRRKVLRHRREIYRVYAARMARKYRNLVVDSTDFSGLARRADSVDEEHENKTARRNRQHAAVSTLRDALKSAFTARHGADAVHPAPLTLKFKDDEVAWEQGMGVTCFECKTRNAWDTAAKIEQKCENCDKVLDQDRSHAHNQLDWYHNGCVGGALAKPKKTKRLKFAPRKKPKTELEAAE